MINETLYISVPTTHFTTAVITGMTITHVTDTRTTILTATAITHHMTVTGCRHHTGIVASG